MMICNDIISLNFTLYYVVLYSCSNHARELCFTFKRALQTDSSTKSRRKSIADGCKCAARGPQGVTMTQRLEVKYHGFSHGFPDFPLTIYRIHGAGIAGIYIYMLT